MPGSMIKGKCRHALLRAKRMQRVRGRRLRRVFRGFELSVGCRIFELLRSQALDFLDVEIGDCPEILELDSQQLQQYWVYSV